MRMRELFKLLRLLWPPTQITGLGERQTCTQVRDNGDAFTNNSESSEPNKAAEAHAD
jgi:hypothetical protein